MMFARWSAVFGVLGFLFLLTGSARADFCIVFNSPPNPFFDGRGFALPAKGKCKAFSGFAVVPGLGGNNPVIGTGCVSSDGTVASFTLVTSEPASGGSFFQDAINMTLPSLAGVDIENGGSSAAVTGQKCSGNAIPALRETPGASAPSGSPLVP